MVQYRSRWRPQLSLFACVRAAVKLRVYLHTLEYNWHPHWFASVSVFFLHSRPCSKGGKYLSTWVGCHCSQTIFTTKYIYIDMCRISYDCHALQARLREVYDDLSGNLCGPMGQEIPTWHHNFDEASAGTYNLRLFNDDGSINKVGEASLGARALCAIIYAHKCICGACLLHQPSLLRYMRTCEKWGEMLL